MSWKSRRLFQPKESKMLKNIWKGHLQRFWFHTVFPCHIYIRILYYYTSTFFCSFYTLKYDLIYISLTFDNNLFLFHPGIEYSSLSLSNSNSLVVKLLFILFLCCFQLISCSLNSLLLTFLFNITPCTEYKIHVEVLVFLFPKLHTKRCAMLSSWIYILYCYYLLLLVSIVIRSWDSLFFIPIVYI